MSSTDDSDWNVFQLGLYKKLALEDAFPLREKEDFQAR